MSEIIVIHSLDECLSAFAEARKHGASITLKNPQDAVVSMGLLYIQQMLKEAEILYPEINYHFICDCGDDATAVQSALRMGFTDIRFDGAPELLVKLQDIATYYGALVF